MTHVYNIKFMNAVTHWLSLFPSSPINPNDDVSVVLDGEVLADVLRLILDESFMINNKVLSFEDVYDTMINTVLDVKNSKKLKIKKKLSTFLQLIKFEKLIERDIYQLNLLIFILLEIGLNGIKSSLSISMISLLNELDQIELKSFMYDEKNIFIHNLKISQQLENVNKENQVLKDQLNEKISQLKYGNHINTQNNENVNDLQNELKLRIDSFNDLKQKYQSVKVKNVELVKTVDQLNYDFESLLGQLKNQPADLSNRGNSTVMTPDDYESILWDLKIFKDLIRFTFKNK